MDESVYELGINILPVGVRPCRRFQEQISDYGSDGRPCFLWEELRHKQILRNDPTVLQICSTCSLNIFQGSEGCKGPIYGLDSFLRAVARLAPESPWVNMEFTGECLEASVTAELAANLDELEEIFDSQQWKVAQMYQDDEPIIDYFEDGSSRPRFVPWNGEAPPSLVYGNDGYQVYLCAHGIIVKSNFEDAQPHVFKSLHRTDNGAYGVTAQGETINFQTTMARYPEWDKEDPRSYGDLRFEDLTAAEVFRDSLDTLMVFTGMAVSAKTGIFIRQL